MINGNSRVKLQNIIEKLFRIEKQESAQPVQIMTLMMFSRRGIRGIIKKIDSKAVKNLQ